MSKPPTFKQLRAQVGQAMACPRCGALGRLLSSLLSYYVACNRCGATVVRDRDRER